MLITLKACKRGKDCAYYSITKTGDWGKFVNNVSEAIDKGWTCFIYCGKQYIGYASAKNRFDFGWSNVCKEYIQESEKRGARKRKPATRKAAKRLPF